MLKKLYKRLPFAHYPYKRYMFNYNCLFIHIPKNAGTSVMQALGDNGGRLHLPWYIYQDANPFAYRKMHKFAIVRHPLTRLHSAYSYIINGGNGSNKDLELQKLVKSKVTNFKEFVCDFVDYHFIYNHELFRPQYTYICNEFGALQVDSLLRLESLINDWAKFSTLHLKCGKDLPFSNRTTATKNKDEYCDSVKQKVYELYRNDFTLFNYSV